MICSSDVEKLTEKVYKILADIGIMVENEEVTKACLEKGCTAGVGHRIKIPKEIIDEMVGNIDAGIAAAIEHFGLA